MKKFHVTVAVLIVVGCASLAQAQRPGGGRFGGGGAAGLLLIPEVQAELNVTEAQKEKLQALRGPRGDQQNLSREERRKQFEELAKKADETIKNVLDEKQQQRLAELRIQREGAGSLARTEVAEKLGLDQAQKDQLAKIQTDSRTSTNRPDFQNATQEERAKLMAEARERREKTDATMLAVLKPEQKKSFEKMHGTKFTFPQRQGRRPAQ